MRAHEVWGNEDASGGNVTWRDGVWVLKHSPEEGGKLSRIMRRPKAVSGEELPGKA